MTVKEAKEILNKEGWCSFQTLSYKPKGLPKDDWEKPEVYEALKVCWDNYIMPLIKKEAFNERKERLESGFYTDKTTQAKSGGVKDYEKVAQIVDKLIEEEGEPINGEHLNPALHESAKDFNDSMLDEQAKRIKELEKNLKFYKEQDVAKSRKVVALEAKLARNSDDVIQGLKNDHILTIMSILKEYGITVERVFGQEIVGEDVCIPFNVPEFVSKAIKAASKLGYQVSYSQDGIFDLDIAAQKEEQKKKLEATVKNREEEIDILNDTMARRIKGIQDLKQTVKSDNAIIEQYEKKVKELGKQIAHLNEVIGKKNAQIKDYKIACEEHDWQLKDYMLSDKNKSDMISGLKKLNEKYRHQLADATISKVNEQALKSSESALVYKDKVIGKQKQDIDGLRKEIKRLKKNVLNATGVLVNSISKESAAHKYMKYTEEVNKGYAMDVYEQQKKLVEYVLELMDEIPTWVDFYSEWKEAENNFNNMSREELDKFFNEMFPNKFVW